MFKATFDPELVANGEFFVVFDADFTSADMYAVLANDPPPIPIILDHDAGVDDLVALVVIASASMKPLEAMPRRFQLIGTTVLDADCFAKPAGELCRRVLAMFRQYSSADSEANNTNAVCDIPVGVSPLPGTAAPFPDEWRKDCLAMLDLPLMHTKAVEDSLAKRPQESDGTGHELLARLVMESPRPVTIVATGPLTNIAYALNRYGKAFADKVREVSIMGGAVHVPGNVINANLPGSAKKVDGSAEWNIYWDAAAARDVLESPLIKHKLLYSLDATNHVPVTSAFVHRFGRVCDPERGLPTQLATFIGTSWAQTTFLEYLFGDDRGYFAWDVLSAVGVLTPTLVKYSLQRVRVDATKDSASEGQTIPVEDDGDATKDQRGGLCRVAMEINNDAFYRYVLECAALF